MDETIALLDGMADKKLTGIFHCFNGTLEQAEKIQNKQILYLEHDGHMGFLESPKVSNKGLRKFLRTCFK